MKQKEKTLPPCIVALRKLRTEKCWDQVQCAEELGCTYDQLRSWEGGYRAPTKFSIRAIDAFVKEHSKK